MTVVRVLSAGPRALLAEVGSVEEALAVYSAARAAGVAAGEVVPGARTVLFDDVADLDALRAFLRDLPSGSGSTPPAGRVVEVPTTYDGVDLDDVARLWGLTPAEVVAVHTRTEFVVAFCGFAPGFAYCAGLPAGLEVPRLPSPRPRVPAGAVALAGEFTGVYPSSSPGGWRLLGRTDLPLWDPAAAAPATLTPGTRVRFVEVGR